MTGFLSLCSYPANSKKFLFFFRKKSLCGNDHLKDNHKFMHKCAWQACKFDLLPSLQIGIETWNKHDILNSDQSFYSNENAFNDSFLFMDFMCSRKFKANTSVFTCDRKLFRFYLNLHSMSECFNTWNQMVACKSGIKIMVFWFA